jgi:hypothetical protein
MIVENFLGFTIQMLNDHPEWERYDVDHPLIIQPSDDKRFVKALYVTDKGRHQWLHLMTFQGQPLMQEHNSAQTYVYCTPEVYQQMTRLPLVCEYCGRRTFKLYPVTDMDVCKHCLEDYEL